MSSVMTAELLVKKSCINLCSLCCSCCSIANYSVLKPKDHWVSFQLLCFNIFFPFYYKEYVFKKCDEVCKHEGFQPNFKQLQVEASAAGDPKVLLAPREGGQGRRASTRVWVSPSWDKAEPVGGCTRDLHTQTPAAYPPRAADAPQPSTGTVPLGQWWGAQQAVGQMGGEELFKIFRLTGTIKLIMVVH